MWTFILIFSSQTDHIPPPPSKKKKRVLAFYGGIACQSIYVAFTKLGIFWLPPLGSGPFLWRNTFTHPNPLSLSLFPRPLFLTEAINTQYIWITSPGNDIENTAVSSAICHISCDYPPKTPLQQQMCTVWIFWIYMKVDLPLKHSLGRMYFKQLWSIFPFIFTCVFLSSRVSLAILW